MFEVNNKDTRTTPLSSFNIFVRILTRHLPIKHLLVIFFNDMAVLLDLKNYFMLAYLKIVEDTLVPKQITVIPHNWKLKNKLPIHSTLIAFQQVHEDSSCENL